jgi:lysyl-tRNA synthetase class 1
VGLHREVRAGREPETDPFLDRLAGYALAYYEDFVKPPRPTASPTEKERAAMEDLVQR